MNNNYECIKCDYKTVRKYNYDKHLRSSSHIQSEDVNRYECKICKYVTEYKGNYKRHKLNCNNESSQNIYECELCKFKTIKRGNYNMHLNSKKHINNDKIKSINNGDLEHFKNEVITTLMSQFGNILEENNKSILVEQTKLLIEQNKINKIMEEIASKPTTSVSNINTLNNNNNQHFNLNVFLNETCKDAMNLSEFLENLNVSMEDMEKTGELGFAKGMSRIIMNNLNAIDVCKRPIHCSDAKRETLYIKNNGVWEKETEERKRTKEIIYKVSCLNTKQLLKWRDLARNKGYDNSEHAKNDEFMKLVMEVNKLRDEEIDKVITSISKHVAIDKDRVKMSGYLN
jgi:hypothetical protein